MVRTISPGPNWNIYHNQSHFYMGIPPLLRHISVSCGSPRVLRGLEIIKFPISPPPSHTLKWPINPIWPQGRLSTANRASSCVISPLSICILEIPPAAPPPRRLITIRRQCLCSWHVCMLPLWRAGHCFCPSLHSAWPFTPSLDKLTAPWWRGGGGLPQRGGAPHSAPFPWLTARQSSWLLPSCTSNLPQHLPVTDTRAYHGFLVRLHPVALFLSS